MTLLLPKSLRLELHNRAEASRMRARIRGLLLRARLMLRRVPVEDMGIYLEECAELVGEANALHVEELSN